MASEYEVIQMPNGLKVCYVDADHSYWRFNEDTGKRGRRLTGVTTITKALDIDPSNLLKWAAKTQCTGFVELFNMLGQGSWMDSGEAVWETAKMHDLTYDNVRDAAATVGKNVHEIGFEALGHGKPVPDLDALTEQEQGHVQAIMAFWLDHTPNAELVEQVVYSERMGVAGRLDFYGTISSREGKGVIDAKTGNYLGASAHAQVGGGYPTLLEESGFGKAEWAMMLKTSEDGTYELVEAEGDQLDFECAVNAYRAAGRINGRAQKARKARQAVAA